MGRIYTHHKGLFYDYRRAVTNFKNEYFNNEEWLMQEEWFVLIRLNPHFWQIGDLYYDGHWMKSITILGIEVGFGYSYDSRPYAKWTNEELAR